MTWAQVSLLDALASAEVFVDGDWVESKDQDPEGDVRLIQLADVGDGSYVNKSDRFLTSSRARALRCTFLKPGDVLVARMPDPLGRACIFPGDPKASVTVVDVCIIRPDTQKHDARWLMHCLNAPSCRGQISGYATGTTRSRISRGNLGKIRIPLPPLAEQRRIAEILDKADGLRAKRRAALAQLDALTHCIFLDMFGDPGFGSDDWPLRPIGELGEVQGGLQVSGSARKGLSNDVPYLRVANVHRGRLDLHEIKRLRVTDAEFARTRLTTNDLLVVEGHGNPEEIGRVALWDGSIDECVHQNHLIRVRVNEQALLPLFACTYLNSAVGRHHLLRAGKTTSGLNTITVSDVRASPMLVPPLAAQRRFVTRVNAIADRRVKLTESATTLDSLFASLQHRAFRGEL